MKDCVKQKTTNMVVMVIQNCWFPVRNVARMTFRDMRNSRVRYLRWTAEGWVYSETHDGRPTRSKIVDLDLTVAEWFYEFDHSKNGYITITLETNTGNVISYKR